MNIYDRQKFDQFIWYLTQHIEEIEYICDDLETIGDEIISEKVKVIRNQIFGMGIDINNLKDLSRKI